MKSNYDKYTFFWSGPFSQWSESPFEIDGRTFNCAEQYMMYKKARAFGDLDIAQAVLQTNDPYEQKKLGRKVKNFNVDIWATIARDIVFRGNVAKYTQDVFHYDALMATRGTMLVETSPKDNIWGIGMGVAEANNTPIEQWKGSNWLGQVLTEVREGLEYVGNYKPGFKGDLL